MKRKSVKTSRRHLDPAFDSSFGCSYFHSQTLPLLHALFIPPVACYSRFHLSYNLQTNHVRGLIQRTKRHESLSLSNAIYNWHCVPLFSFLFVLHQSRLNQ